MCHCDFLSAAVTMILSVEKKMMTGAMTMIIRTDAADDNTSCRSFFVAKLTS